MVETEADILLKSTSKELYFDLDDRSVVEFSFPPIKKNLVNFFFSKTRFIGLSLSSSSLDKSFRGIFEVFVFSSSPFGGIFL